MDLLAKLAVDFCSCWGFVAPASMLVTKALLQELLDFVTLSLIPKESPSLHSNQTPHIACIHKDVLRHFVFKHITPRHNYVSAN